MKKFFLFAVVLATIRCYAATGSASDGELAVLIVIAILLLPVASVYIIRFLKQTIRDMHTRRMLENHRVDHNGEI
jgi:hypothetical protein